MDPPQKKNYRTVINPVDHPAWERYSDKPSRFKAVLISCSSRPELDVDDWELVEDEWIFHNEWEEEEGRCVCSQEIENHYFRENIKTRAIIPVGSECIKKFGNDRDRELMDIKERRRIYCGEKAMCVFCCENRVSVERSVSLCNKCLDVGRASSSSTARRTGPSREYLDALGVPCSVCQEERIVRGQITCCQSCKQFSCETCTAPLHSTTRGMYDGGWYHLCPYCKEHRETGIYCLACKIPLTAKQRKYGNIECTRCHFNVQKKEEKMDVEPDKKKERSCTECSRVLPVDHPSHQKKCKSCYFGDNKTQKVDSSLLKYCPECKQNDKKFHSWESWCKVCLDCYKR